MRYLILADIHANLEALQKVLERAKKEGVDKYIILGDVIDYGASPNETLDLLRGLDPQEAVRGDHEKRYTGDLSDDYFVEEALICARWTQSQLNQKSMEYIRSLPAGPRLIDDNFMIVHGAYTHEDDYILDVDAAKKSMNNLRAAVGFFGHTHVPLLLCDEGEGPMKLVRFQGEANQYQLEETKRYLINPGSVGQPRDGDPRTAFAVFDSAQRIIHMYRLDYDNQKAARRIADAGLPEFLSQRLLVGY